MIARTLLLLSPLGGIAARVARCLFPLALFWVSLLHGVEWFLRLAALLMAITASCYSIREHRAVRKCKTCPFNPNSPINNQ